MTQVRPGRQRKFKVPRGALGPLVDPFRAAFRVGRKGDKTRASMAALSALAGHLFVAYLAFTTPPPPVKEPKKREIPIIVAERPPPPPPPVVPPPPPPPKKVEGRQVHNAAPKQASKVVAAKAAPAGPADGTGWTMPEGTSDEPWTGGPVQSAPPPKPEPAAAPVKRVAPVESKAREANALGSDWNCAWPDAEQASEINSADVTIDIKVGRNGQAEDVKVEKAPNANFAEGAKQCGFDQHYDPAWDDAGHPISSTIDNFVIHFVR